MKPKRQQKKTRILRNITYFAETLLLSLRIDLAREKNFQTSGSCPNGQALFMGGPGIPIFGYERRRDFSDLAK
jgi:hypothetical protein